MERWEVLEMFKLLKSIYPKFEVNSEKADIWTRLLKDQDGQAVMKNAERHTLKQKFPPTIADIRETTIAARDRSVLDKIKEWEKNASGLPRS